MIRSSTHPLRSIGLAACIMVAFSMTGVGAAGTATETSISTTPTESTVEVGETVTFDVIVDDVSDGIKSYEFDAALHDPSAGTITDVTLQGTNSSNMLTTIDISEDGSSVGVSAGSASHDNGIIATITVETTAVGTSRLSLTDVAVGDNDARNYDITATNGELVTLTGPRTSVGIQPETTTLRTDELETVEVVVDNLSNGIDSYEFDVEINDPDTATIENIEVSGTNPDERFTDVSIASDGSSASAEAAVAGHNEGVIATVTLRGHAPENTTISLNNLAVGTTDADSYLITDVEPGQIEITASPTITVEEESATDMNNDGVYEDVNGNNELDIVDVNALFDNRNSASVTEHQSHFDFNGNGEFDIVDVNELFEIVTGSE